MLFFHASAGAPFFFNVLSRDKVPYMRGYNILLKSEASDIFVMEGKWWFGSSNFYGFCGFWRLQKREPRTAEETKVSICLFSCFIPFRSLNIFFPRVWSSNVCFQLTSSAVDRIAYAGSYGGDTTTRLSHEVEPVKRRNTRSKLEVLTHDGGKNTQMDPKQRISHFKPSESATGQTKIKLTSTAGREDLPELYILVLVSFPFIFFILFVGSFTIVSGIVVDFCLFVARGFRTGHTSIFLFSD